MSSDFRIRALPPVPRLVGRSPYDYAENLQNFLERLDALFVVTNFSALTPMPISAGVAGAPGVFTEGWSAGGHIHAIGTAAPSNPLSFGTAATEGAGTALLRAGMTLDTSLLETQVDAKIAAANANALYLSLVM